MSTTIWQIASQKDIRDLKNTVGIVLGQTLFVIQDNTPDSKPQLVIIKRIAHTYVETIDVYTGKVRLHKT